MSPDEPDSADLERLFRDKTLLTLGDGWREELAERIAVEADRARPRRSDLAVDDDDDLIDFTSHPTHEPVRRTPWLLSAAAAILVVVGLGAWINATKSPAPVDDQTINVAASTVPSIRIDGPTTVEVGETLNLTVTVLTGSPTSWRWDTDGGVPTTATTQNVSIAWTVSGTYTVTLTATDAGVAASDTHTITVIAPEVLHEITLVSTLPEPDDFTLAITTNGCASVVWTVSAADLSYTVAECLTDHALSPGINVVLTPNTAYTVNATFTFPDGHQEVRSWQVTTTTAGPDPVVTTSNSLSGADVTVTMTSDVCTVLSNAWFSSTDGGPRGIADHTDFFPNSTCQTSRSYTFTRETDEAGSFRPYRINVTYSLPDGSWSQTTVDNL